MYVAYLHFNNPNYDYCKGNIIPEWICYVITLLIALLIGGLPRNEDYEGFKLSPAL